MIEQTCGITDNDQEIVLQQDQDPFFKKNMYLNFGDLGASAKEYVDQYAAKRQGGTQMESIADMKRFVEEYPEFRKLSSNVTKHITLVGELSRRVGEDNLLDVSELESRAWHATTTTPTTSRYLNPLSLLQMERLTASHSNSKHSSAIPPSPPSTNSAS